MVQHPPGRGRVVPVTECWMVLGGIPAESSSGKRPSAGAVALRRARAGEGAISTWVQIALANSSNATANRRLAGSSAASS
jgi:hypothetical protein